VRAGGEHTLGVNLYVVRNHGSVPMFRRFFLRDVLIGDKKFDHYWIINARREAHAQAFLSPEVRSHIESVPAWTNSLNYIGEVSSLYYDFDVRGQDVMACTANFETDPERMEAAISAAVALALQPKALLTRWKQLAADLGGRLEHGARFRMDGSTRVHLAVQGSRVVVSPIVVRLKGRRDRLRTRVSCECSGTLRRARFEIEAGQSTAELGDHADMVEKAMHDSDTALLRGNGKLIYADLDGNITDESRIMAAASAVAILARGDDGAAGPYR
jgi:hypothetical protein